MIRYIFQIMFAFIIVNIGYGGPASAQLAADSITPTMAGDSDGGVFKDIVVMGQNRARIEAAIEERRLVLIKRTDAARPYPQNGSARTEIVQGYVFDNSRLVSDLDVECHVNPAFLWIVVGGSELIVDNKVVLDIPEGAQAILGFYARGRGDPLAGEPEVVDRFFLVDSLTGSGRGAYLVLSDEMAKLFKVSRRNNRLVMTPVRKTRYICKGESKSVPARSADVVREDQRSTRYLVKTIEGNAYASIKTAFKNATFRNGRATISLNAALADSFPRGTALLVNEDAGSATRMNSVLSTSGPPWFGCSESRSAQSMEFVATINCGDDIFVRPMRTIALSPQIPIPFDTKYHIESKPTGATIIVGERAMGPKTNNTISLYQDQVDDLRLQKNGYEACYRADMTEVRGRPIKTFSCVLQPSSNKRKGWIHLPVVW